MLLLEAQNEHDTKKIFIVLSNYSILVIKISAHRYQEHHHRCMWSETVRACASL